MFEDDDQRSEHDSSPPPSQASTIFSAQREGSADASDAELSPPSSPVVASPASSKSPASTTSRGVRPARKRALPARYRTSSFNGGAEQKRGIGASTDRASVEKHRKSQGARAASPPLFETLSSLSPSSSRCASPSLAAPSPATSRSTRSRARIEDLKTYVLVPGRRLPSSSADSQEVPPQIPAVGRVAASAPTLPKWNSSNSEQPAHARALACEAHKPI